MLVRVIRLTDRHAPDGSWAAGDEASLTIEEARAELALGRVALATGETLTMETAAFDGGETPERTFISMRPRGRNPGSVIS